MRRVLLSIVLVAAAAAGPSAAQVRTIDPNRAVDGDLAGPPPAPVEQVQPESRTDLPDEPPPADPAPAPAASAPGPGPGPQPAAPTAEAAIRAENTFARDDLLAAGEGVFGKGAAGLAGLLERVLKEQGEPNAYIAGREAAGAFVVGLRYGSGVMTHKVEGERPVYWTGPSVGFDVGGDADKVFVLVYNLYDGQDLFRRFPAAEGRLYAVGGFTASYLRRGDVVLIPVRLGVGWRAGVNIGYMRFSEKQRWLPF